MSNSFFQKINPFGDNSSQRQEQPTGEDAKQAAPGNHKLEVAANLSNVSKRKSASNLLHFNIANPFKSLHSSQQQQQHNPSVPQTPDHQAAKSSGKIFRGSAGALEPVLQQLSKMRVESQQQQVAAPSNANQAPTGDRTADGKTPDSVQTAPDNNSQSPGGLLQVQQAHLSSSHHNLFASKPIECSGCLGLGSQLNSPSTSNASTALVADGLSSVISAGGSSSVTQSPTNGPTHRAYNHQVTSTSARASAHDLHLTSDQRQGHSSHNVPGDHHHNARHHHHHQQHNHNHHNHHAHHLHHSHHHHLHHHHHHHNTTSSSNNTSNNTSNHHHHHHQSPATSHAFISMDWIQLNGEPPCGVCKKPLKGQSVAANAQPTSHYQLTQTAPFMCKTCKLQVHAQCQTLALADCMSRVAESSRAAAERQESSGGAGGTGGRASANDNSSVSMTTSAASTTSSPPTSPTGNDNMAGEKSGVHGTNSNVSRDNIRLHRLAPSVKHVKRPDATKPIIEGWLKHTTLSDEQAKRHYWRLDDTDITLYENDTSTRYFKAIALNKITRVISASSLPKRVKEDVLLTCGATDKSRSHSNDSNSEQKPSIVETSADPSSSESKSADTSPAKSAKIADLKDQMSAMFAFELTTGSVYLVQANSENEASKWRGSLANIMANLNSNPLERTGVSAKKVDSDSRKDSVKKPEATGGVSVTRSQEEPKKQSDSAEISDRPSEEVNADATPKTEDAGPKMEVQQQAAELAKEAPKTQLEDNKKPEPEMKLQTQTQQQAGGKTPTKMAMNQRHHHHHTQQAGHHYRGQHKTYTDPNRSRLYNRPRIQIKLKPMDVPDHWIEGKYLIERDRVKGVGFEELGSGQFGKVYAAISEIKNEDPSRGIWSGVPVAIKEISKARFDLRQQAKLKNEANILSRLDHPGVIILERVHDLPDKIYIVMEQLEDDMLEMIVSTEEKRLNERITKFLTYQILEALKYLHSQHIAHCDLKPENVLLVERRSQFPQIKLCDFGFAKIIEENSFRCSLVGTPAYLAPEVVKGEKYNRSVDLWSVGVIVYVSLSGEFPFNEGENIHDQISRANFMYPDQPWAKISSQAKNFINSLLRVNSEKRLAANKAQMDVWLQDYQLWCDLSELEVRVGKRWVTDDADFEHWSRYARERGLQVPRSAIQLHEDLIAD